MSAILLISEMALAISRRSSRSGATAAPGGSHRLLWVIIGVAIFLAWQFAANDVGPRFVGRGYAGGLGAAAAALFAAGSGLRWWAIRRLGRFFTVDVATAADQHVVQDGPYRYVRHPSYTGLLLQFMGLALTFNHLTSFAILIVPVAAALSYRITREEAVLREKLGTAYVEYCGRTRRLVPGVY